MYFPNYRPSGVNNIRKVTILLTLLCIVTVLVTFSSSQSSLINQNQITDILSKIVDGSAVLNNYGQLPLSFEANQGQVDSQVEFLSRGDGYTMYLTGDEAIMVLNKPVNDGTIGSADVIRLQLVGANVEARTVGEEKLPGKVNYFIGNNPEQWQTGISTYSQVRYEDVYPGIDLVYYGNQSQLEYDFVVHPGVDPDAIALRFDGTDSIQIDPKGNLVLSLGEEQLIQNPPIVYQEVEGKRLEVELV